MGLTTRLKTILNSFASNKNIPPSDICFVSAGKIYKSSESDFKFMYVHCFSTKVYVFKTRNTNTWWEVTWSVESGYRYHIPSSLKEVKYTWDRYYENPCDAEKYKEVFGEDLIVA